MRRKDKGRTIVINPAEPRLGYSSRLLSEAIEEATLEDVKLSLRFLSARQQDLVGLLGSEGGELLLIALPKEEREHLVFTGIAVEKPCRFDDLHEYELTKLGREVSAVCRLCQPIDDTAFRLEQLEERLTDQLRRIEEATART